MAFGEHGIVWGQSSNEPKDKMIKVKYDGGGFWNTFLTEISQVEPEVCYRVDSGTAVFLLWMFGQD